MSAENLEELEALSEFPDLPVLVLGSPDCGFTVEVYHRHVEGYHSWLLVSHIGGGGEFVVCDNYTEVLRLLGEAAPIAAAALLTLQYDAKADEEEEEERC
jgi:hypothetical protein